MPKLFFYGYTGNTFVEEIIREKRKNGKNKENIFGFRSKTTYLVDFSSFAQRFLSLITCTD